jgi:hypothetical protein
MDTFLNHIATQQTADSIRLLATQIRAAAAVRRQFGMVHIIANDAAH